MAYNTFGGGAGGWFRSIPPVTRNLIIINLLIWLIEYVSGSFGYRLVDLLGLHYFWSFSESDFNPAQLVTYMFLHDRNSIMHVLFNMFTLYMFGRIIEQTWGSRRFLFYYFVCGIGAALFQEAVWALSWKHEFIDAITSRTGLSSDTVRNYLATRPEQFAALMDNFRNALVTIGASGAVFGILLAFAFLFPDIPLYLFFIPVPIKAKYMVAGYAVVEFFLGVSGNGGTVAHFAHLGGMIFGLILLLIWRRRNGGRRNPFMNQILTINHRIMIIISPILRMIAGIVSIILYIVTAISCYGGIIPPEVTPLGSVLVIGMPVLLTVSAIVTLAWFCFGHWMTGSLGVVMFLACAGPIKMWFPLGSKEDPAPGNPTFTIMTWNILHGEDLGEPSNKGSRTMEAILEYDPDIVCMQEMTGFEKKDLRHFSQASVDSILARYPYRLGIGTTYDICILSKYPLRHIYFGSVNSFILAEYCTVKIGGREIALANIHLPSFALDENEKTIFSPHGDKEQKEDLSKRIFHKLQHAFPIRAQAAEKVVHGFERLAMPVVVVGDFNDVPASWTYRMFLKAGFKDAYCATNFFPTYTFYPHAFYFHLDQVMYRGNLRPLSVDRLNIRTSDHLPQLATFEILPNY